MKSLGLDARVRFHGRVAYADTGRFYTDSDLVVCPTLADYRSLNGFEAVNAGKPVLISTYDGAHEEIVAVAPAATVIDPRDHEALTAALAAALDPAALAAAQRAAAQVPPDFTVDRVGENLARAVTIALSAMKRLWRRVASIAGRPLVLSQVLTSASGAIATIFAAAFMHPDAFTQFALLNLVAITLVGLVRSFLFQPALIQFRHDKDAHTRFALSGSGALVSGVVLGGSAVALGIDTWWLVALLILSGLFPILQDWLRYRAMAADRRWDVALADGLRLLFVLASPVLLIATRNPAVYQAYLGLSLAVPVLVMLIRLPRPARFTPLRVYIRPAGLQLADFAIGQFNSTLPLLVLGALGASTLIGGVRFAQTLLGPLNLVFAASTTNLIADGATRGTYASTEDLIRNGTRLARVIGLVAVVGVVILTAAVALERVPAARRRQRRAGHRPRPGRRRHPELRVGRHPCHRHAADGVPGSRDGRSRRPRLRQPQRLHDRLPAGRRGCEPRRGFRGGGGRRSAGLHRPGDGAVPAPSEGRPRGARAAARAGSAGGSRVVRGGHPGQGFAGRLSSRNHLTSSSSAMITFAANSSV